jgi:hypothetical protein
MADKFNVEEIRICSTETLLKDPNNNINNILLYMYNCEQQQQQQWDHRGVQDANTRKRLDVLICTVHFLPYFFHIRTRN